MLLVLGSHFENQCCKITAGRGPGKQKQESTLSLVPHQAQPVAASGSPEPRPREAGLGSRWLKMKATLGFLTPAQHCPTHQGPRRGGHRSFQKTASSQCFCPASGALFTACGIPLCFYQGRLQASPEQRPCYGGQASQCPPQR